ncbi:MAG: anti-sigma-factor antagonist [Bryobacterales bacterium]|jgi:anti-sigma B factor antagonist|nr:anti-sigma-factor antagonist [Bryobacterales bacterium]
MPLQIDPEVTEGLTIFRLKGRLIFGEEASALQDAIEAALADGNIRLILDLKVVPFIDSTGLGVLVVGQAAAQKAHGAIRLLHLSQRHLELLVLTKLTALFQIYDDENAAIDSFFPERAVKPFDILEFVKSQEDQPEPLGSEPAKPGSSS